METLRRIHKFYRLEFVVLVGLVIVFSVLSNLLSNVQANYRPLGMVVCLEDSKRSVLLSVVIVGSLPVFGHVGLM